MASNSSEDNNIVLDHQTPYLLVAPPYFSPAVSSQVLPCSGSDSLPYLTHDPARAHSHNPSEEVYPTTTEAYHQQQPSFGKGDLNPSAKPFVARASMMSSPIKISHDPSLSQPLNVAAPIFKPSSEAFMFHPPPSVPQMPIPEFPKSLPPPPRNKEESSPFWTQGREKKQRRGSATSMEEGGNMASFKFPRDVDSPRGAVMKRSTHPGSNQDLPAEPSTHARLSAVARPLYVDSPSVPSRDLVSSEEEALQDKDVDDSDDSDEDGEPEFSATNCVPVSLDFKHPVGSNNTVPAGLFKALANEERTRRTVRSRLCSPENFEPFRKPSMDDNDVPAISSSRTQRRTTTFRSQDRGGSTSDDDVFGTKNRFHHSRRRSSLPDNLADLSSISHEPAPSVDFTTNNMEVHRVEYVVEEILEAKFAELRKEIAQSAAKNGSALHPSTEAQIADVISLFRMQLQESAVRGLDEDAQMDARGELDFQLIRDMLEESRKELLAVVRTELSSLVVGNENGGVEGVRRMVEGLGSTICEHISELVDRQEVVAHATESDGIIDKIVGLLSPMILSARSDPVDCDLLTDRLAQAVKPHITQLIDLASDKRETAGLIVQTLLPLLPPMKEPVIDVDAIALQLIVEIRKLIEPINAFEMGAQVADLVVERLESTLHKVVDVGTIVNRVSESVETVLEPSRVLPGSLERMVEAQEKFEVTQKALDGDVKKMMDLVEGLPTKVDVGLEGVISGQKEVLDKLETMVDKPNEKDEDVMEIKMLVEAMVVNQKEVAEHSGKALVLNEDILAKVKTLPETIDTTFTALTNLVKTQDSVIKDLEESRKANVDYQVQLVKARSAHGQVRVEKEVMNEKLVAVEAECERLRGQVRDLEKISATKGVETSALEARNAELQEALSTALSRLQATDVTAQSSTYRIVDLEKLNVELVGSRDALESQVCWYFCCHFFEIVLRDFVVV